MIQHLEAIYENGVLRPLAPVNAPEHSRVQLDVTVAEPSALPSVGNGRLSLAEFDRLLDELATSGPPADCTFPRSEIYADHD